MRLSLRSWRSAADNDLHLGPSLVQCAPAQLSHHYHTHATWRRPVFPAPLACTFNRIATGCQPSKHHGHSYSHQAGGEGGEPDVESSAPASTATGFQLRQLRARQAAEARTSDNAARGLAAFRNREPEPGKVPRHRNAKLDKAGAAQKSFKNIKKRKARFAKLQKEGIQRLSVDSPVVQDDQDHYQYWLPEIVAAALHLEALEKADEAAQYAKETACRAEKAAHSASVCKGRYSEEAATRETDSLRTRAELVASIAEQLSNYAAEKEKRCEAIRGELQTRIEAQPILWDTPKRASSKVSGHKLRGLVHLSCRVCGGPHSPSKCGVLFDDMNAGLKGTPTFKAARRIFKDRMSLDKDFGEAMPYILSKFTVSKGPTREVIPMNYRATADAPASAIRKEYLRELDNRIYFRTILGKRESFRIQHVALPFNLTSGYYITTSDDGTPLAILYIIDAPANIATDPHFELETQMIKTFVTRWSRGEKSSYGQDPFPDLPSISIVFCKRWHRTKTTSADPFRPVLSLAISNEQLWSQGLFYSGIHIGTKDDEITSGYDWWSYGRFELEGGRWFDGTAAPVHRSTSQSTMSFAQGLIRATTRNVKDPIQPILSDEFRRGKEAARLSQVAYCQKARNRVVDKYGMESAQHSILSFRISRVRKRELRREALLARNWAPSWETIMRLEQDEPEDSIWQPRPKIRLRRLQRAKPLPRPHHMSVPGQGWPSKHGTRRLLLRDATPGEEPVGTETESRPAQTHKSRRPGAIKKKPLFRSILPEPAWRKPSEGLTKSRAKRDQPPTKTALFRDIFSDPAAWREPSEGVTKSRAKRDQPPTKTALFRDIFSDPAAWREPSEGVTKSRAKRDQPRASRPRPSKSQKSIASHHCGPDEADIPSSTDSHAGSSSRTPGAFQQKAPMYRAESLFSGLDPAPETAAASSKAKTREAYRRRPRSRRGKVSVVQHLNWS